MEKETENKVSQVKPQKAANKSKSSAKKSKPKASSSTGKSMTEKIFFTNIGLYLSKTSLFCAINIFKTIIDFKDTKEKIELCNNNINKIVMWRPFLIKYF